VNLLKRIPLGNRELKMIRERAEQLKEGTLRSRGEALLPIMLASFIFDVLVMPGKGQCVINYHIRVNSVSIKLYSRHFIGLKIWQLIIAAQKLLLYFTHILLNLHHIEKHKFWSFHSECMWWNILRWSPICMCARTRRSVHVCL